MSDHYLAIISAGRPSAVEVMGNLGAARATWYVPEGEVDDYSRAGADRVKVGGGLIASRNMALDDAFAAELPCVQLSDDLKRTARLTPDGKKADPMPLMELVGELVRNLGRVKLAGVAPTDNPFYASHRVNPLGFIVGDLFAVAPSKPRFDPQLRLKEDYDFTCQHVAAYGAVARYDYLLASFAHRSNPGGAVAYRTAELEQEAIAVLLRKWPGLIKANPRRANEVLLRFPKPPRRRK